MSVVLRHHFGDANSIILPVTVISEKTNAEFMKNVASGQAKPPSWPVFRALLDTGATSSCITEKVRKQLDIPIVGTENADSAFGPHEIPTCNFCIALVQSEETPSTEEEDGLVAMNININLTSIHGLVWPDNPQCDVIIGMDIIKRSLLIIDGKGIAILSVD